MEKIRENPSNNQSGIAVPMNKLMPKPIRVQEKISAAGINQRKANFTCFVVLTVGSIGKEEALSDSDFLNGKCFPQLDQIACFFLSNLRLVHSAHVQDGG